MVVSMVLSTIPILEVSCSRNAVCNGVKSRSEASSITAFTLSSKSTGSTMTLRGTASNSPELIGVADAGRFVIRLRVRSTAHCPTRPSPSASVSLCDREPWSANEATRCSEDTPSLVRMWYTTPC